MKNLTESVQLLTEVIIFLSHLMTKAETASDLAEIREELHSSGYASRMKSYTKGKSTAPAYLKFKISGGYTVLCGKNNIQNEYITHRVAEKTDYWFHAKGVPGSHVVLVCNGEEPDGINFTEAAEIAAHYSKHRGGQNVEVDYTFARNVKKTGTGKPGLVIYHTNWSAVVTPDAERIAKMRIK